MQTFTSITMEAIGSVASAWDDSRTARGGSPSALVCEHLETSGLSRGRVERVMGIEPTLFAWEARVLPLNDTRDGVIVGFSPG